MKKRLIGILFVLVLAIGYTACGNSYHSPTAPANAPGNPMTPTPVY